MRFALLCAGILILEMLATLTLSVQGRHEIIDPDGVVYALFAENLVNHGAFSLDKAPPYDPSLYRTPGYPLFLAALRLVGGDSLLLVRVVQFLLLGGTAAAVYATAKSLADTRTARVAALLCLTYLPFVWLARMHLTETLASLLVALTVLVLVRAQRLAHYAAVGLLLGAVGMVRPAFSFAVVPIALALLAWPRVSRRIALKETAVLVVALVIALIPWTVRNYSLTGEIQPFGGGTGGTSLLASAMQYQGIIEYRFDGAELDRLDAVEGPIILDAQSKVLPDESSDVPLSIRQELAAEDAVRQEARDRFDEVGLGDVLRELVPREAYLWAVSDYPPEASAWFWHRVAQLQHVILFLLAFAGVLVGVRRFRARIWPLLVFPVFLAGAHLVLHSEGRYSVPARPAVIVLSAIGLSFVVQRLVVGRARAEARSTVR